MKKSLKNKTKKPVRHPDYFEVTVEYIKDKLDVIIEGQVVMNERFERKFDEAEVRFDKFEKQTENNFKTVFEFIDATKSNFKTVFDYLSRIDDELKDIKDGGRM